MTWRKAIVLKTAPPTLAEAAMSRQRLSLDRCLYGATQILEISAPLGFGKTSLLTHWRAEALAAGRAAIWFSLDAADDGSRFVQGLLHASSRQDPRVIGEAFLQWARNVADPYEALTAWLAEIERSGREALLLLDDADLAPPTLREGALAYVLANAPANLRTALSTRPGAEIARQPAFAGSPIARIGTQALRLMEEETVEIVARALPPAEAARLGARIQGLTDGWPLGVHLALTAQLGRGLAETPEETVSLALGQFFTDRIVKQQPEAVIDLLTSLALLDPVHPDLCRALAGPEAPVAEVLRLADLTPLLIRIEGDEWLRLNAAARDVLSATQAAWPETRRRNVAHIAAQWYAERGLYEEAANQARLAGESETALDMAERAMREMTVQGRTAEVLDWVDRMAADGIERRPAVWLPAAWAALNSLRFLQVEPLLQRVLAQPGLDAQERFEALLIEASTAGYSDDLRKLEHFAAQWPEPERGAGASEILIHALCLCTADVLRGRPGQARKRLASALIDVDRAKASAIVAAFVEYYQGLSLLWEGKAELAYELLRGTLRRLEGRFDPRHRIVTTIAAVFAEAAVETDHLDEARSVILRRLPEIEKIAVPDAVIAGYLASARLAEIEGRLDLAEEHISGLVALGRMRKLPRIEAVGLGALARFNARNGRDRAAEDVAEQLSALVAQHDGKLPDSLLDMLRLQAELAAAASRVRSEVASDLQLAAESARKAQKLAIRLECGRERLAAQGLYGRALLRQGQTKGHSELREAAATARAWGLQRMQAELGANAAAPSERTVMAPAPRPAAGQAARPGLLTAREYDVLHGLAAHLSNKEIAISLNLSDETVKWHVKNLFQKLGAGERKTAVARARVLGML
ncbi:LuxR C-terminal-related transcriptional regulator [Bradyrhizobium sp. HKCCYLS2038]|uniref:LuxR C-terminal-related transcriptional regulator n=1 Tax=unclassified Bradyrhizobium TaxID=2631580 RepID=UPI003EBC5DBC